jgi:hypothetical protein
MNCLCQGILSGFLKNAKQFAYAKKLDSLLKDYQKQLQQSESMVQPEQPSFFEQFLSSGSQNLFFGHWPVSL